MVVAIRFSIPKVSCITLVTAAREFVVQEAFETTISALGSKSFSLTPSQLQYSLYFIRIYQTRSFAPKILFLDEIGTLSMSIQSKLLRVLQENQFYRVGGTKQINVNVRVICANNISIRELVDREKNCLKRAFGNRKISFLAPFLFLKRAKSLYNCLNPY